MDNAMPMSQWTAFIGREYLNTFIKDGGASVKFVVAGDNRIPDLDNALSAAAAQQGYAFARINAADTRVHMPQDIFHAISRQTPWRELARQAIIRTARQANYGHTENIDTRNDGNIYAAIGAANGTDAAGVIRELRPAIHRQVAANGNMTRDFRAAMNHLCLLESAGDDYGGQPIIDWLTGDNQRIGNVRHFSIHTPINRTTARHFLESSLHWTRMAGYNGTVILLNNAQVTVAKRQRNGPRFYTKPMVIDHYELLRELTDRADQLPGTLFVVIANPDFMDEDARRRGYGIYEALMTRIMNDVQDRNQANPTASLVRLE